jgi:hypothetical protein
MSTFSRYLSALLTGLLAMATSACLAAETPIVLAAADTHRFLPSPDALIGKTLQDIRASRLDDALKEVDRVISIRPDFKLAHLIRGDLLMARAKPLSGLGAAASPLRPSLSPTCATRPGSGCCAISISPIPASFHARSCNWRPSQKYALLADAARARLYLFENVNGEPRLLRDYYMTIGKNGTDKRIEGDKKTPVGVYLVTEQLSRKKLTTSMASAPSPSTIPTTGTGPGPWRPWHLAAWRAFRHLQPAAPFQRWLRGGRQSRPEGTQSAGSRSASLPWSSPTGRTGWIGNLGGEPLTARHPGRLEG